MTKLEELEQEAANIGAKIDRIAFRSGRIKGLYVDGNIALSKSLKTSAEQASVLAEEIGHHVTSCGDILSAEDAACRQQELVARQWAYDRLIGLDGIIRASKRRCANFYEMALYLDVTEDFLREALDRYRQRYGRSVRCGDWIIIFDPALAVIRLWQTEANASKT